MLNLRGWTLLMFVVCALPAWPAHAADYYVSTTGSDGNAGSVSAPWQTIAFATSNRSPVAAGDTIHVRGGTYRDYVQLQKSGRADAPIRLRQYAGEFVVLTGGGPMMMGNIYAAGVTNWIIGGCPGCGFEIRDSVTSGGGFFAEEIADGTGTIELSYLTIHNTDNGDNASCITWQRNLGHLIVRNNIIYDCDGSKSHSSNNTGILIFGHIKPGKPGTVDVQITNNEIYNEAVAVKWKHPSAPDQTVTYVVAFNVFHDIAGKGAIYAGDGTQPSGKTCRFHHNIIHSSPRAPAFIIGDDFDSRGCEIDHNTAYGTRQGVQICVAKACDDGVYSQLLNVHDNILAPIARTGDDGFAIMTENVTDPFSASDYNCVSQASGGASDLFNWGGTGGKVQSLSSWRSGHNLDAHSVRVPSVGFVSPTNFHLTANSPCKNLRGDGTDPGAYETGNETIGPPPRS